MAAADALAEADAAADEDKDLLAKGELVALVVALAVALAVGTGPHEGCTPSSQVQVPSAALLFSDAGVPTAPTAHRKSYAEAPATGPAGVDTIKGDAGGSTGCDSATTSAAVSARA